MPVETIDTVEELRAQIAAWRKAGDKIALVPTMGALHAGHLMLVEAAQAKAERVVVSIFVNPSQFGPNEDFSRYPRRQEEDLAALEKLGVPLVFAPSVAEMYPQGFATTIGVDGPALGLETDFRPNFFRGVATVVAKLLIAALPDFATFGEKDYQQMQVVRRMVADLAIPTTILPVATMREPDGLALSSRNLYLGAEERQTAPLLYRVLTETASALRAGMAPAETLQAANARLSEAGFRVDYVALCDAESLERLQELPEAPARLLAAAWLGTTRLIDNIAV
ncbi:pantoate--beta-alanine ligase [Afifella sp. IM 167]|uniref:pantoate--beta-alanine ligase n=1 Tax=Afifella sp. IM 167 TaxID=2033586 RepID=UPI001CC9AF29|nr:pantoate--beta-alanine ligase [Afifella sp. IM 167]